MKIHSDFNYTVFTKLALFQNKMLDVTKFLSLHPKNVLRHSGWKTVGIRVMMSVKFCNYVLSIHSVTYTVSGVV